MSIPRLSTELTAEEQIPIVRVHGEIDLYTVPEFEDALKSGMQSPFPGLIVDLTDISYVDSAGLGALLAAYKNLSKRDGRLFIVANPHSPGVRKILEITRLDTILNVVGTLKDAIDGLRSSKAA
ncbi:MAG TPA: STAS domain-containing protein [Armatimonadota bacterium]